jgi:hypothetical protein
MLVNRDELRACLARKRLNQQEASELIGLSVTGFANKLNGKREFSENEIVLLVKEFGTSILNLQ